eukprot:TRINITY_DN8210_c0_g2_i1.p1 TRINITY_DN8210_c0_g2~~TRINITY_DN8210_c0_g2_i1.p1  ORF type:complete len:161 (+),score=33.67 TRINITY_DN8210_c0_g2_i1:429-911(+)
MNNSPSIIEINNKNNLIAINETDFSQKQRNIVKDQDPSHEKRCSLQKFLIPKLLPTPINNNIPGTAPALSNSIDKIIQRQRRCEIPVEIIDEKVPVKVIAKKVKLKQKKLPPVNDESNNKNLQVNNNKYNIAEIFNNQFVDKIEVNEEEYSNWELQAKGK